MLVGLSVCVGLACAVWQMRTWAVLTHALIIGICALALGRMGYVALHWVYFVDHTNEIFSLASPSFQEHAALCGGFIGYWLLARLLPIANSPLPIVLCISLIGMAASLGCIANGCAYGREVFWQSEGEHSLMWLVAVDWPDAYGINNPRLPTQLFMAGWLGVVGSVVMLMGRGDKKTRRKGDKTSPHLLISSSPYVFWLLFFALGDFIIQFARGDASPIWAGLRTEQWLDVAFCLLAAAGIVRALRSGETSAQT
jgi:prolipoprotein diacylglyceryltransferase